MSPIAPIELRASIAFCTSSGGVIALMKNSTSSRPYLPNSWPILARRRRRHFVELGRQVEQARLRRGQHVGQPADDQVLQVRRDVLGRVLALRADQLVEQLDRVVHAEGELAVGPQPDDAKILVADGDRLPRAPFLVEEGLLADEIDLGLKRRLLPRDREHGA